MIYLFCMKVSVYKDLFDSFFYFMSIFCNINYLCWFAGRYAEGKNRHGMDHYASKAEQPSHVPSAYSPPQEADNPLRSPSAVHVVDESCMNFSFDEEDEMGSADFSQQQHPFRPPMGSTQKLDYAGTDLARSDY